MNQTQQSNRRIVLNSRPHGAPAAETFRLENIEIPIVSAGEILLRTVYLSQTLLIRRIKAQGFIIFDDYGSRYGEFAADMGPWVKEGKIKFLEDVVDGLEEAAQAFIGLLTGKNFGKLNVRVGDEDV